MVDRIKRLIIFVNDSFKGQVRWCFSFQETTRFQIWGTIELHRDPILKTLSENSLCIYALDLLALLALLVLFAFLASLVLLAVLALHELVV